MLGRTAPPTNAEIEAVAKRLCWNSCKWDGVDSYAAKDEDDAWDYAGEIPGFHATGQGTTRTGTEGGDGMIIRESSTYRHAMEVTIVRAEAIAIEETPDKLTIILDKETMRLSEYPVNGVPVEELNGYIDEMASSMNLLSKRRLFARDIMTGAKAATAACIRGLEKIIRKHEARS